MKAGCYSRKKIILLWLFIALFCSVATVVGYSFFGTASDHWMSFIQAFAGGAILMMLANSMIRETYEYEGKLAGEFTVFGFYISASMAMLENR